MPHGDFQSYLRLLRGFFAEFQSVLREKSRPPPRLALHYQRAFLVYGRNESRSKSLLKAHFGFNCSVLCLYPNQRVAGNAIYRLANWLILCNAALVLGLVVYALHETNNTVDMGDDMVWIIGVCLGGGQGSVLLDTVNSLPFSPADWPRSNQDHLLSSACG